MNRMKWSLTADRLVIWYNSILNRNPCTKVGTSIYAAKYIKAKHYVWVEWGNRFFLLCRAAAHSDCCFPAPCTNILTYFTHLLFLVCCRIVYRTHAHTHTAHTHTHTHGRTCQAVHRRYISCEDQAQSWVCQRRSWRVRPTDPTSLQRTYNMTSYNLTPRQFDRNRLSSQRFYANVESETDYTRSTTVKRSALNVTLITHKTEKCLDLNDAVKTQWAFHGSPYKARKRCQMHFCGTRQPVITCRTLISVCNQPATQGQLSLTSLRCR